MALHPQLKAFLDSLEALGAPPLHTVPVSVARTMYDKGAELTRGTPPEPVAVEAVTFPGPGGTLDARLYRPAEEPGLPILVFFHGGGFTIGSLDSHDSVCRALSVEAHCLVLSVDYRLAPEHKFPAAVEDAWAATCWAVNNAHTLGGDPDRVAVGGDSAGGNLAAVVCLMAQEAGDPQLSYQLLIYPGIDMTCSLPSHTAFADGYRLTRELITWFYQAYFSTEDDVTHWQASPINAHSLAGLPPAYILSAGYDPLQDENKSYAYKLEGAGVPVTYRHYPDMIHGFYTMPGALDRAREAISDSARALRTAFGD
ncbi:MAG: alpha/beta hydrolase [Pseudohongiellaceae bacterium]|jgi:acetyl esterase